MKRGELWWAQLAPPLGRRPVLLLSRDSSYSVRNQATVAFVTTRIRGIPVEVPLGPEDGLPEDCVVNLDNINTIHFDRLRERVGLLDSTRMAAVDRAIHFALGLRD
jgi:mRNA interferase MazF